MEETCKVEGCGMPKHAKGLCMLHYGRMRRWGDPCAFTSSHPKGRRDESVESKLKNAMRAYELVTGLKNRIRWKQEIAELEAELQGAEG